MATPFDGMTGVLNGVFGAPVTHAAPGKDPRVLTGVFREKPAVVEGDDGRDVLVTMSTVRIPAADAAGIARNDWIVPGNGKTYRVVAPHASGSPAADRFVIFELEEKR